MLWEKPRWMQKMDEKEKADYYLIKFVRVLWFLVVVAFCETVITIFSLLFCYKTELYLMI